MLAEDEAFAEEVSLLEDAVPEALLAEALLAEDEDTDELLADEDDFEDVVFDKMPPWCMLRTASISLYHLMISSGLGPEKQ